MSALETVDLYDARYVRARDRHAARLQRGGSAGRRRRPRRPPSRATRRRGRRAHAARGRAGRARTPARIGLRRSRHDRAPPRPPTSTTPVDLQALPWPDPEAWVDGLASSPLVAVGENGGDERPLRLVGTTLYLDRYWRDERFVAADLLSRNEPASDVDAGVLADGLARLFDGDEPDLQRLAAATCVLRRLAVVGGGPGTGKTTTVTRILVAARRAGRGRRSADAARRPRRADREGRRAA